MTYEVIMIDPVAAQHVSAAMDIESYDLCVNHLVRWHTYHLEDKDLMFTNGERVFPSEEPVGALIPIRNGTVEVASCMFGVEPRENGFVVRRIKELHPTDTVMRAFGSYDDAHCCGFTDDWLVAWIRNTIMDSNIGEKQEVTSNWNLRLRAIQPVRSTKYHGKISVFQSSKDADNDRQVAMKAGRAFRFIFPELDDSELETIVDAFRENFSLRKYTLKTGKDPKQFTHAYSHDQADMDNPNTTYERKAMIHSCMRYDFDHLPRHPCSAYGSGDFEIIWLEDDKGCIAGRCVVYIGGSTPAAGPIYGVCEKSLDMIQSHVDDMGATVGRDDSWDGAKLLSFPHQDGYIGPYLDVDPKRLTVGHGSDDGFLIVDEDGEVDASKYQGILGNTYHTTCCECECELGEDDYYYSEHTDGQYCECCYGDEHTFCEHEQEMVHNSTLVEVWTDTRWGERSEMVSEGARDNSFVECTDGKYWHEDDVRYCEYNGEYVSSKTLNDDYFESDWNDEIYPNELKCVTEDDESVSVDEVVDGGGKVVKIDGVWKIVKEDDE